MRTHTVTSERERESQSGVNISSRTSCYCRNMVHNGAHRIQ